MKNKLKKRKKTSELNLLGNKTEAFTLIESLCVLAITMASLIMMSYPLVDNWQKFEQTLFIDQFKHLLDRTQQIAITTQNAKSILNNNKAYTLDLADKGSISYPFPKCLKSHYQQKTIFYDSYGDSEYNKIIFTWPDGVDTFQYQLFNGHYRYRHEKN